MVSQPLRALFVLLLLPLAGQAIQSKLCVQVLIPEGMPIKMEVERDQTDPQILKYIVTRSVPKDARQAKITTVMLDQNGTVKYSRSGVGNQLNDPMSIATADISVARILLIVELLETDRGKWVPDTKNHQLNINLLIKHGAEALPKARFISNAQLRIKNLGETQSARKERGVSG